MVEGGWRWEKAGWNCRIQAGFPASSHDFPAFPTFSHLIFLRAKRSLEVLPDGQWVHGYGVRGRWEGAECYGMSGFPSPPRDGCPSGVVRWRETWSRCFMKVN